MKPCVADSTAGAQLLAVRSIAWIAIAYALPMIAMRAGYAWNWWHGYSDLEYVDFSSIMPGPPDWMITVTRASAVLHPVVLLLCGVCVLRGPGGLAAACWAVFAATLACEASELLGRRPWSELLTVEAWAWFLSGVGPAMAAALVAPQLVKNNGDEVTCLTCDYNLRGLVEVRCPECGNVHSQ